MPVGGNGRVADRAVLVGPVGRRAHRLGPARHGLREGGVGIVDVEAMSRTPSPWSRMWSLIGSSGPVGRRQHEAGLALLQGVGRGVAPAGFEARVRELGEAERLPVVVGRLLRVAHPELDVVDALQPERIVCHGWCRVAPSDRFAQTRGGGKFGGRRAILSEPIAELAQKENADARSWPRRATAVAVVMGVLGTWAGGGTRAQQAGTDAVYPDAMFGGLNWRSIGPDRGGRSIAVAGSAARPLEYYFGATGGGLWKTTDGGTTWSPAADKFLKTSSVGAVAVAESNPDVVYVGMGEDRTARQHHPGRRRLQDHGRRQDVGARRPGRVAGHRAHPRPSEEPRPGLRGGARQSVCRQ